MPCRDQHACTIFKKTTILITSTASKSWELFRLFIVSVHGFVKNKAVICCSIIVRRCMMTYSNVKCSNAFKMQHCCSMQMYVQRVAEMLSVATV